MRSVQNEAEVIHTMAALGARGVLLNAETGQGIAVELGTVRSGKVDLRLEACSDSEVHADLPEGTTASLWMCDFERDVELTGQIEVSAKPHLITMTAESPTMRMHYREPRVPVLPGVPLRARLDVGHMRIEAVPLDLSSSGLRVLLLGRDVFVLPEAPLSVNLIYDHAFAIKLSAKVVWCRGAILGLNFEADGPLVAEGARATRRLVRVCAVAFNRRKQGLRAA